ncbi:hypothetical protein PanWU01x14_283450 [Parasponia andersonii]|uniref:Uncharacterized protein n=1 Tax=Parasponia andersonii TaxID=3476 RepID=A0A2P5B0A8_PARAD|nr:hypothetical protein PanWU01x14_283450 [Parasponia andersonii]
MPKRQEEEEEEDHKGEKEENNLAIWDCGSPLYDSYELVSLSHLIERHLMVLPSIGGSSKRFITQFSEPTNDLDPPMKNSNVGTTKLAKGCSMVARLGGLVERKIMWKRKKVFGERKDQKPNKKMKTNKLSGFYNRIASWRKQDY